MNRYDHGFRGFKPMLQADAGLQVSEARGALIQHWHNGFGHEDDKAVVRQFGIADLNAFWEVELSEPVDCDGFVWRLSVHFTSMSNKGKYDIVKASLRSAIRAARVAGAPWFREKPKETRSSKLSAQEWLGHIPSDVAFVPADPPADGIDLSKLLVEPRAAAEWLLAMPKRKHLVPPSLAEFLRHEAKTVPQDKPHVVNAIHSYPHRPQGTGYRSADKPIARQMVEAVANGSANSLTNAANHVVGGRWDTIAGAGTPESKLRRLVNLASEIQKNGE